MRVDQDGNIVHSDGTVQEYVPTTSPTRKSYEVTAGNDPIAKALEKGIRDGDNSAPQGEYVAPWLRKNRQIGPVIPHGWAEQLRRPVAAFHSLSSSRDLAGAREQLDAAIAEAGIAADAVSSLSSDREAEQRAVVDKARAQAKAGEPVEVDARVDWEIENEVRLVRWREAHKRAQKASATYAATAKAAVTRDDVIKAAEKVSANRPRVLALAEQLQAEVEVQRTAEDLIGQADAALRIGARWTVDETAAGLPGEASAGAQAVVKWARESQDPIESLTDTSTTLPLSTRVWMAGKSSAGHDFVCRLEAYEQREGLPTVSRVSASRESEYVNSALYPDELKSLRQRTIPRF